MGKELIFFVEKFVGGGSPYIQLENDGRGNFTGQVFVPRTARDISVGVSNSQRGSYQIVAKYSVKLGGWGEDGKDVLGLQEYRGFFSCPKGRIIEVDSK